MDEINPFLHVVVFVTAPQTASVSSTLSAPFCTCWHSLTSSLLHSRSLSAVGWQKPCLGEFWYLWSGCQLPLEKPTAEQTVTTTPPPGLARHLPSFLETFSHCLQCSLTSSQVSLASSATSSGASTQLTEKSLMGTMNGH